LIVIPCLHHKVTAHKLALLVITQELEDVLQYYYDNIRSTITPEYPFLQKHFFSTYSGGEHTQVYRHIKLALTPNGVVLPVLGLYRIKVSSEVRHYLNEKKHQNIVKHLNHSKPHILRTYDTYDTSEAHASLHTLSMLRRWSRNEIK